MERQGTSPASLGLLTCVIALCISAIVVITAMLPYREYLKLKNDCTKSAPGTIVDTEQYKEGIYYYGPTVEYRPAGNSMPIHIKVINTAENKKPHEVGKQVQVLYAPDDFSFGMIEEDKEAERAYKRNRIIGAAVGALGITALILGVLNQFVRTRPKKFSSAPDGSSFEEWAERKKLEEQAAEAQKKLTEDDTPDNNDHEKED